MGEDHGRADIAVAEQLLHGANVRPALQKVGANEWRTASLPAGEFIGRFLTHVLPPGFKRIRHYGLLASRHKAVKLVACRALLDVPAPVPAVIDPVAAFMLRGAG